MKKKINWSTYPHVYDLFINSTKVKRIWGQKKALDLAQKQTGRLFEQNHIELVNIHTGEIIFST